ncbi:MAG: hypothetical protein GY811_05525 [Myxococcales bacterium]|nr:hypothetical protein [Myxococcales bacterium]
MLQPPVDDFADTQAADPHLTEELATLPADSIATSMPGAPAGRYVLGELVGRGGMGSVLECRDSQVHRNIAIKLDEGGDGHGLRFHREARLQEQLEHPAVVPIYDVDKMENGQ